MQWNNLTMAERASEKKRFNILAEKAEDDSARLDVIEAQLVDIGARITRLEKLQPLTVDITVLPAEANPATVTFDGQAVTYADSKYSVSDVLAGEYALTVASEGYVDFTDTIAVDIDNTEFEVTLEAEPVPQDPGEQQQEPEEE